MREFKQHRKNICQIEATYLQKSEDFEHDLGLISKLYVRRFLRACEKDEFDQAASKHKQKLCRLGLNWQNVDNNLGVVTNVSSKKLVKFTVLTDQKSLKFNSVLLLQERAAFLVKLFKIRSHLQKIELSRQNTKI